ncbi:MAG: c-type cytochrome, partial [Bacteroidetes bacterium]|nr:c-type cytochrome [Bacteroidota bacterium]
HVSKSAPLQSEEYKIEMAQAEQDKAKYMATQTNNVDENTVTMLSASEIEMGKKTFSEKCIACHGANGGSMPGGVGPNLTDNYWIHGGGIKDIFKSIKYGWVEKGMISWKDQLSSTQIAQLASFIRSINGSKPANAKDPQGELYSEVITATDTTTKDTTKLKK